MSVKCPSCGFDSPESAQWCDFCKEPFRRKEAKLPESPPLPAAPPGPKLTYRVPPTVAAQERAKSSPAADKPPAMPDDLPPEAHQRLTAALSVEEAEKVPAAPKWVRWAAWAFLGIWFIAGMILTGVMLGRQKLQQQTQAPAPLAAPAP